MISEPPVGEPLVTQWLGRVPYGDALERQLKVVEARRSGACGDTLLLLEHPPVVTAGRNVREESYRASPEELAARGIDYFSVARGGDLTYHAPGQLVGYLIMDLAARGEKDVHRFVRRMEAALMTACARFGVATRRVEGRTGVFVDAGNEVAGPDRKLASIGVGVKRWITFHGFALNVSTDLGGFDVIVPCGLADVRMTSIAAELGGGPLGLDARARREVAECFVREWASPVEQ